MSQAQAQPWSGPGARPGGGAWAFTSTLIDACLRLYTYNIDLSVSVHEILSIDPLSFSFNFITISQPTFAAAGGAHFMVIYSVYN